MTDFEIASLRQWALGQVIQSDRSLLLVSPEAVIRKADELLYYMETGNLLGKEKPE